jgi:hypothetical protein
MLLIEALRAHDPEKPFKVWTEDLGVTFWVDFDGRFMRSPDDDPDTCPGPSLWLSDFSREDWQFGYVAR